MQLLPVFLQIVDENNKKQCADGSFAAGVNGPYNHPETPVRNTSHWIISNSFAYTLTNDSKYKDAGYRAAQYLLSKDARPHGQTFHYRNSPNRDMCSGVIGQAWSMEALFHAARLLEDPQYSDLAVAIYRLHEFDEETGFWYRREVDGNKLSIDWTFNHQLWFAAMASYLSDIEIRTQVHTFLDSIPHHLLLMNNGCIFHPSRTEWEHSLGMTNRLRSFIGTLRGGPFNTSTFGNALKYLGTTSLRDSLEYKSIGYHAFNTYALGILRQNLPEHPFWQGEDIQRVCMYLMSDSYAQQLIDNIYGFPYNPPGFEIPFSLYALDAFDGDTLETTTLWVQKQFDDQFNNTTKQMDKNTSDVETLTARVYELTRLPVSILEKIVLDIS